ncbi:hypothetical protein A3C59_01535 [Candidatus Daviesbacteria bacterium RIFCSPHIGHO2_02_FULL_36_13]|uniref:Major facilitator superfamily (MFS) profile domain-containing protein n=1 Tax=Candidatus Daviesbacteria bacterium RIFCSPHIGHO2_02_FULL_36_13 TaxID=1797768 RepID=A0A1F5JV59_9BACT|nr:MAG: hypothetical protein A3C59_01535 [Candidatus Daviesbacteria bacterium RIFCSPHIGHO2_02_FULL_36_13]
MIRRKAISSVIENRGFLNLWINQFLVQLSFNALNFALIIWVFQLTHSNTAVSALLFAIYLPAVIFGLFSGVLVDLIDRKKIILTIDILLSVCFFSLIFFKDSYLLLLFITFIMNSLAQFYGPAEASAIPLIVEKKQLISANSIFSATLHTCFLLGFGVAGPLIHEFGIDFIFRMGGGLLVIASILALFFPSIISKADKQGRQLAHAIKTLNYSDILKFGSSEISQTMDLIRGKLTVLSSIFILAGIQMVIGVLAVLMPGFMETALHIKAIDASFVLVIPLGVGVVSGGLFLGRFGTSFMGQRLVRRIIVGRSIIFGGALFFLIGVAPILSPAIEYLPKTPLPFFTQPSFSAILVLGSFLMGIAMVSILVPTQTVLQENTPESKRGKVFASLGVVMAGLSLIPVFLAGILADQFGVASIFVGLGAVIILIGLFGLWPSLFFSKDNLPYNVREFLGLGHWKEKN